MLLQSSTFINFILPAYNFAGFIMLSYCKLLSVCTLHSLVPRPPLAAFFRSHVFFFHGCEKSCEGRPRYEATHYMII